MSDLIVYTDDVLNTNNNDMEFVELRKGFKEHFDIEVQEGYLLKCLNLQNFQSPLGFSVYQTDHIIEQVNEWFPIVKLIKVDKTFRTGYIYIN